MTRVCRIISAVNTHVVHAYAIGFISIDGRDGKSGPDVCRNVDQDNIRITSRFVPLPAYLISVGCLSFKPRLASPT